MPTSYDSFTEESKQILLRAHEISSKNGLQLITSGHLMQGILEDESMRSHLEEIGINPDEAHEWIKRLNNMYMPESAEKSVGLADKARIALSEMTTISSMRKIPWYAPIDMFYALRRMDPLLDRTIFPFSEGSINKEKG